MSILRKLTALGILAAVSLLPSMAMANMLDDFETLFNDISANYQSAITAGPDSRIATDYDKKFGELSQLADRLQNFVARLNIEDINLRGNVQKFRDHFQECLANKGKAESRHRAEGSAGRGFSTNLIREDMRKLRAMGFTTDNGGSYKNKLVKSDGFDEFDTLLNQYSMAVKDVSDNSVNNEWRQRFEKRLGRMKVLASEIQSKLIREMPATAKKYNFVGEVGYLDGFFKDLVAENARIHSEKTASNANSGNANRSQVNRTTKVYDEVSGRTKNVSSIDRIMQDVRYSISRTQKGIVELKELGFSLSAPATREAKDKSEGLKTDDESDVSKDVAAMSADEIYGAIQRERDRIYKANLSMDNVSPAVVKYYTKTLTKSQRELYQTLVQKYQHKDRGYAGEMAGGMALKELHGRLKTMDVSESKADLGRILEGIRKDKANFEKDLDKERYAQFNK